MRWELSDEQADFRAVLRAWLLERCSPSALREWLDGGPDDDPQGGRGDRREVRRPLCAPTPGSRRPTAPCRRTAVWGYSEEYHVARCFREARLLKIAPLSQEMVLNYLGSHVLGLPRSC